MDYQERKAWAPTLKEGDEVCLIGSGYYTVPPLLRVQRLTATQMVLLNEHGREYRARRDDGRVVGRDYTYIDKVTDEVREKIEYAALASWLSGLTTSYGAVKRDRMPLAVLRAMKATYDEHMPKQEPAA